MFFLRSTKTCFYFCFRAVGFITFSRSPRTFCRAEAVPLPSGAEQLQRHTSNLKGDWKDEKNHQNAMRCRKFTWKSTTHFADEGVFFCFLPQTSSKSQKRMTDHLITARKKKRRKLNWSSWFQWDQKSIEKSHCCSAAPGASAKAIWPGARRRGKCPAEDFGGGAAQGKRVGWSSDVTVAFWGERFRGIL